MTSRGSRDWNYEEGGAAPRFFPSTTQRSNRRRLLVFLGTLTVALAVSLGFTFLRPAEYRASARLEITPASVSVPSEPAVGSAAESPRPFLTEVQVLTSRPVLDLVAKRLERSGQDLSTFGADPLVGIQSSVEATPVPNTNVVELVATGRRPEVLAPLLNAIIDVYRERLAASYRSSSSESMAQVDEEVKKLESSVAVKRREAEGFRIRNNIVSLEREENEVLARVRGLSASLNAANDRVATAEGKLRSLSESAAAGKAVVRSRDNPTLANLEQRASQIREDLRDLERTYTADYLAKDPKAIALRARLSELERQVKVQGQASQQAALLEAQEELESARETARRLQNQISTDRRDVGQFTSRFNEYKSLQDELAQLETVYRDAVQRRARLEASERARMPATKVLEAATPPQESWRPVYWRDSAVSIGGSLVLALLAMWLVELFNRSEPQPTVIVAQPMAGGIPLRAMPQPLSLQGTPAMALEAGTPALLPQRPTLPRELRHEEVAALIQAGDEDSRVVLLLLLSGISPDELLSLRRSDVDLAQGVVRVSGGFARDVAVHETLRDILAARPAAPGTDLLIGAQGRAATLDGVNAQILCAGHDAGIEQATEVTAQCLQHTYVAFLVRQGIRFADLTRIVGALPAEVLGAYSALSPPGARAPREAIDMVFPGVRGIESS